MVLIIAFVALVLATLVYQYWPRSREALYEHRLGLLRDDMRKRGLSPAAQIEELTFRRAMARLRRRASEAVLKNPASPLREIISVIAVEESKAISDRDVARRFLKVARDSPYGDVLYADAQKAVRQTVAKRRPRLNLVTDDDIAAVTIRR